MDDGRVFAGDVAMDLLNYCRCRHRPIWLSDIREVYASWERLIESGAKVIYPAHGDPFGVEELRQTMTDYPVSGN
jgi:glyoxylase-like metal-dependent hydrolase (beta-lactamase superfamily II)